MSPKKPRKVAFQNDYLPNSPQPRRPNLKKQDQKFWEKKTNQREQIIALHLTVGPPRT